MIASGGLSVTLPLVLCGVETSFVVDTGASVTLVSTDTFNRIPAARRPRIQKPDETLNLEVADSGPLPVDGAVKLPVEDDGHSYVWDMCVASLPDVVGAKLHLEQERTAVGWTSSQVQD